MYSIGIDDDELVLNSRLGIYTMFIERVAKLDSQTEGLQGRMLKKTSVPFLTIDYYK